MIEFNYQVCSVTLSKELKTLGLDQEGTNFEWTEARKGDFRIRLALEKSNTVYAATLTTDELGKLIYPNLLTSKVPVFHEDGMWKLNWQGFWESDKQIVIDISDGREANVRAALLVLLLKNKILTIEEVNKRLNNYGNRN